MSPRMFGKSCGSYRQSSESASRVTYPSCGQSRNLGRPVLWTRSIPAPCAFASPTVQADLFGCMSPCSTLDPALRMERRLFPDPRGLALLGSGVLYLLATPGVLAGFIDTYILSPLQRLTAPVYGPVRMSAGLGCHLVHRIMLAAISKAHLPSVDERAETI